MSDQKAQTVLNLAVTEDSMKQIKTCFFQEPDEVQQVIKKLATNNKRDFLVEYANYTFLSNLEKAYEVQRVKYVASHVATIELLVKNGVDKEKALVTLGIEQAELDALKEKAAPRKGVARKLAVIQAIYGN